MSPSGPSGPLVKICCETGQLGSRVHIQFPAQPIAILWLQITLPIQLLSYYALVDLWFFGDPLSYTLTLLHFGNRS